MNIFKLFKKQPKLKKSEHSMLVHSFNEPNNLEQGFRESMGISEEFHDKIFDKIHSYLKDGMKQKHNMTKSEFLCELSKECTHPNQLAYVSYLFGHIGTKIDDFSNNPLLAVMQILGQK